MTKKAEVQSYTLCDEIILFHKFGSVCDFSVFLFSLTHSSLSGEGNKLFMKYVTK